MSTNMPILYMIHTGDVPGSGSEAVDKMIYEIRREATYFDIQVGCDVAQQQFDKQGHLLVGKETGCVKPPYPKMWLEWTSPEPREKLGCFISEETVYEDGDFRMEFFMIHPEIKMTAYMCFCCIVTLDESGRIERIGTGVTDNGPELNEDEKIFMAHIMNHCLTGLALMNCKNVNVPESGRIPLARTTSQKRRKIPARKIKYHTIMLPGGGTQSDGKGGHRATAIHRVRGHFKTFTAEKPLLGQHVGTYWWGWQVRGKAENGIVVSDYKVGVK